MKRLILVSLSILALSSCGPNQESMMLQGSGSTGKLTQERSSTPVTEESQEAEVRLRWNAVAQGIFVEYYEMKFDFLWLDDATFPHPTFKGGSGESYEAFARIFVAFFDAGDNLAFLKAHNLVNMPLRYELAKQTSEWTFPMLAALLSDSSLVTPETQVEMRRIADLLGR